jgi:hypothetical protein
MRNRAIQFINNQINSIRFESEDDEGAMEWQGHLESVRDSLASHQMSIEEAAESLGYRVATMIGGAQ